LVASHVAMFTACPIDLVPGYQPTF